MAMTPKEARAWQAVDPFKARLRDHDIDAICADAIELCDKIEEEKKGTNRNKGKLTNEQKYELVLSLARSITESGNTFLKMTIEHHQVNTGLLELEDIPATLSAIQASLKTGTYLDLHNRAMLGAVYLRARELILKNGGDRAAMLEYFRNTLHVGYASACEHVLWHLVCAQGPILKFIGKPFFFYRQWMSYLLKKMKEDDDVWKSMTPEVEISLETKGVIEAETSKGDLKEAVKLDKEMKKEMKEQMEEEQSNIAAVSSQTIALNDVVERLTNARIGQATSAALGGSQWMGSMDPSLSASLPAHANNNDDDDDSALDSDEATPSKRSKRMKLPDDDDDDDDGDTLLDSI